MQNGGNAEVLLEYSAGTLESGVAAAVAEHIGRCAQCRELVRAQQEVWGALEVWEPRAVSPDFDSKLYDRIGKEVSWWEMLVRPLRPLSFRNGLPIAAAACLLVVAGFLLEQRPEVPARPADNGRQLQVDAQHALEDMQILGEFNGLVSADAGDPRM